MKKRVLLLDDDVWLARSASRELSREFDVDVYLTGEAAIKALQDPSRIYECIVSDMDMAGMNGLQFYHEAVQLRPELLGHFLFYTANPNPPSTPAPFLRKAANMDELRDTVRAFTT